MLLKAGDGDVALPDTERGPGVEVGLTPGLLPLRLLRPKERFLHKSSFNIAQ